MTLEARIAALEAELAAIKQRLGLAPSPPSTPDPASNVPDSANFQAPAAKSFAPTPQLEPQAGAPPPLISIQSSKEITFGGYWVTRIGAVLVLLGAVFLAGYLSIYSTPAIRISELVAATVSALAIAYWQQARGNLRFALVLHSLGDALGFFTAFAAYAFDPMRVIDTVSMAIAVQTLAGAAVCAHALHRRSEGSALFSLILLAWVAGFSLDYQQSDTTLGYVAAIALIGAALRLRYRWNRPLAFVAIAGPILAMWMATDPGRLPLALPITLGLLPLIVAAPYALTRRPLDKSDRTVCFLAYAGCFAAAMRFRSGPNAGLTAYHWQPLIEAGAFWAVVGLFFSRQDEATSIRFGLRRQAIFGGALSIAWQIYTQFPEGRRYPFVHLREQRWTALEILGLAIATAAMLRQAKRWVPGYAYLAFCGLALMATLHSGAANLQPASVMYWIELTGILLMAVLLQLSFGSGIGSDAFVAIGAVALCALGQAAGAIGDAGTAVLTMLALGLAAASASRIFRALLPWAACAWVMAHLEVFGAAPDGQAPGWVSLAFLTATDAVVLIFVQPLKLNRIVPLPLLIVLIMLGTLFFAFARAGLQWSPTFVWVPLAGATFLLGFLQHNPNYRIAALVAFAPCLVRLFVNDLNSAFTRIVASFLLGIMLLGVGYLYTRLGRFHRREGI